MQKSPWEEFPEIWNTQSKFMSWVRGGIRAGLWKKHPVKLEFLRQSTHLVKNTNPRSMKRFPMIKAFRCAICNGMFSATKIEVDHIAGNSSLKTMDDVRSFIESMILVTFDDLQIVCHDCHDIKTHAEKQGMTFEEARLDKQSIAICKGSVSSVKAFLSERGITPAGNAEKRREQVLEALKREVTNE